jgi:hypothetical protein
MNRSRCSPLIRISNWLSFLTFFFLPFFTIVIYSIWRPLAYPYPYQCICKVYALYIHFSFVSNKIWQSNVLILA